MALAPHKLDREGRSLKSALAILVACVSAAATAQQPVGSEFQVNTYTTGNQAFAGIGSDGADGFVIVWTSSGSGGTDTSEESIQAQRITAGGSPVGAQFQVNSETRGVQQFSAIGPDGAGGFVVTWDSDGSSGTDTHSYSVQAQRFARDGSPIGDQFQVNTYTTWAQFAPVVAPDGGGGFVITWTNTHGSDGTDSDFCIQAQRFASDGSPLGGEFQVNTYTTNWQRKPSVGSDGAGGFVVTWESFGSNSTDSDGWSVHGQRFSSDGSPVGDEFQVNTLTVGDQLHATIAEAAGGFVVTWRTSGSIQAQRYTAGGLPVGGEFQVNTYLNVAQYTPFVAPDGSGGFVVAWRSRGSGGTDTDDSSIQARRFTASGAPAGEQFQVNTYTTFSPFHPAVAADGAGGFVVTWQSPGSYGTDTSEQSIQARRFVQHELFADGFESGDTSAWSTAVP